MKYKELYPSSLSDGIGLISSLSNVIDIPWNALDTEQKKSLERLYCIRSGFKTLTPSFAELSMSDRPTVIAQMYLQKWKRLFEAYMVEFDILDAYHVTESGTREKTNKTDTTTKYGRTTEEQSTDSGTVKNTGTDTANTQSSVFGFNSTTAVPSDTTIDGGSSENTETRDLTNDRTTTNGGQDEENLSGNENEEYSYTKKGNIGYTTPQELIRQSIELWKTAYFEEVFRDIDSLITIHVYE